MSENPLGTVRYPGSIPQDIAIRVQVKKRRCSGISISFRHALERRESVPWSVL